MIEPLTKLTHGLTKIKELVRAGDDLPYEVRLEETILQIAKAAKNAVDAGQPFEVFVGAHKLVKAAIVHWPQSQLKQIEDWAKTTERNLSIVTTMHGLTAEC